MEQRLPPFQSVEREGGLAAHLRGAVGRSRLRVLDRRLHHRARPPALLRRKRGARNQAIGRSRGALTPKTHLPVRGWGCPVRFVLTAGQAGDAPQAGPLIDGMPADVIIADTAYDADHFRLGGARARGRGPPPPAPTPPPMSSSPIPPMTPTTSGWRSPAKVRSPSSPTIPRDRPSIRSMLTSMPSDISSNAASAGSSSSDASPRASRKPQPTTSLSSPSPPPYSG